MARGRTAASPELEKARGYPGKRKSKADAALEQAARLAEMLAAAPAASGDPLAPCASGGTLRRRWSRRDA
jgi:hypothetical protein